jgi:AAA domain/Primase C terminal 2 (PriCT-2)
MSVPNVVPLNRPAPRRVIERAITATVFPDKLARSKREVAIRFRSLPDAMGKRTAPSKDKLPWLKLATFGDDPSAKGCYRTNANMLAIDGVEGDHDAGTMSIDEAVALLRAAPLAAIVYTSASHTPANPRWRVLCLTSRSLPPDARQRLVARLNYVLKGALAPESFNDSLSYYFGRVEGNPYYRCEIVDGRAIDEAGELDAGALGRDGKPYRHAQPVDYDQMLDGELYGEPDYDLLRSALAVIPESEREEREYWLRMGAAVHNATNGDNEGFEIWDEWSSPCYNYDARDQERVWNSFGRYGGKPVGLGTIIHEGKKYGWKPAASGEPFFASHELTVADWLARDIPPPNFVLGEWLSTTTRAELIAPTGLGKTNFGMALSFNIAKGEGFLHWSGSGTPHRVLFIDGEMSRRLMQRRLSDAVRRAGAIPETLFVLNREEFPDMPPLNTEAGQRYIDGVIENLGGIDFVVFDNIQSLIIGDMKDEESWAPVLPWTRDLTRREVGQLWIHHTGHDESHGYGSKTREWQLDVVTLMERIEQPGADIAFRLTFPKARERAPENRADFDPVIITLAADQWAYEASSPIVRGDKLPKTQQQALLILDELNTKGDVTEAEWREACIESRKISTSEVRRLRKDAFNRVYRDLRIGNRVFLRDGKVSRHEEVDFD